MSKQYDRVWIRIAGNSQRIKKDLPPPHWRYEIEGEPGQHLLMGWTLMGQLTHENNGQGTKPTASGQDFLAWIRYFGDVTIDDNQRAWISLRPTATPPPG